jgi:P4 family phage/plasmid primase-like protien
MEGEGANGKSVACAVLTAYLGRENVSHTPLESFGQRFSLIRTLGKLANIASEVGDLDKVAEGNLKAFTSGDRMQFERKFKEPVEALPTARLVLATNNRPRFSDRSGGLWRRMILMPFNTTIPESERVFGMDKPQWWEDVGELLGILLWSLAGLKRLREQRKFTESAVCNAALDDYRLESNPARTFLGEQYTTDLNADIVTTDVYSAYREWCETNGYRPLGSNTFGKEIVRAFPQATQGKVFSTNGTRVNGYKGIGNIPDNPDSGF